jgi:hypothetical protein
LLAFASEFGDLQFGSDVEFSDDPMDACWQLAGVLPVGPLDQLDLLQSQSAEELISRTNELVNEGNKSLEQLMNTMDPGLDTDR